MHLLRTKKVSRKISVCCGGYGGMMNVKKKPKKLALVAREAGVSLPTVSKVLNNRSGVAAATRVHVERVLKANGYAVRQQKRAPAKTIELLLDDLHTPWSEEILAGVISGLEDGYLPVAAARTDDAWRFQDWLEGVISRNSAGVLIPLFELPDDAEQRLRCSGIPSVIIDPTGKIPDFIPTIGSNDYAGVREAMSYLLAMGHRRIAFIGGPSYLRTAVRRLDGFRDAMNGSKVPIDPDLVSAGEFRFEDGLEHARRLCALESPPTAIFAASDMQAAGVYRGAWEAGLRIPRDLSVVGFDDLPTSELLLPPLTTVHHAVREMARFGAVSLMSMIEGRTALPEHVELMTHLVKRASVAEPPSHG